MDSVVYSDKENQRAGTGHRERVLSYYIVIHKILSWRVLPIREGSELLTGDIENNGGIDVQIIVPVILISLPVLIIGSMTGYRFRKTCRSGPEKTFHVRRITMKIPCLVSSAP
jgi:hypothetical protein